MNEVKDKESRRAEAKRNERILKLNRVVCICKGIPLKKVLPAIKKCDTVEEVNSMAGTGQGGCQGRRCGPRINVLLKKKREMK
ncbi:MAG: (2Fe-2S)-binding protein [Pseudomonadota bacterium]|nr:(2Fe-2S)-binding protein [Pseudomonadota bacterium]